MKRMTMIQALVALLLILCPMTISASTAVNANTTNQKSHKVYEMVEEMPMFPGGQKEMMTFLSKTTKYPAKAVKKKIQGRCLVQFIVEKDGSISNVRVMSKVHPLLDAEAIRVVKSMPRWMPGRLKGKPVRVKFNLPVTFCLG